MPLTVLAHTHWRSLRSTAFLCTLALLAASGIFLALLLPSSTAIAAAFSVSAVLFVALFLELRHVLAIKRAYNMAMLAAHDGFWEWDPVSKDLHVGPRLLEILGYREDFLKDTHAWLRLVHPDDVQNYNHAVSRHLKGESSHFYCEYRVKASDGTYRWIASRGLAVRDRHGIAFQMVGSVTDITERREHQEEMEFLAQHDALTGLPNRLLFAERLQQAISAAQQHGHKVGVLFIDLDRFKNINDTLGHRAGDQLLQAVTQRLTRTLPEHAQLYRQGGDEFIVLVHPLDSLEAALSLAHALREEVSQPLALGALEFFTSASIGISLLPDHSQDGESLLRHADTAMYEAKAAGGNAIRTHTSAMDQRILSRMALETQLRQALQRQQLRLHYQPQFDVSGEQLLGAEALLRWHDGERFIPPDQFIPVAEESGLIIAIGDWVMATAIDQVAEWRRTFGWAPPIAINLSARQFWRPALARTLLDHLARHQLPPTAIEVEVTESVLLDAEGDSLEELRAIQAAGIPIALDDFGTGYSSLAYLQRLPVSTLKIDRSFIKPLNHHAPGQRNSEPMVRAIIAMAHSLSLRVIAEGVETPEQQTSLQALGCDILQGYLLGKPMPAAEFSEKLRVDRKSAAHASK